MPNQPSEAGGAAGNWPPLILRTEYHGSGCIFENLSASFTESLNTFDFIDINPRRYSSAEHCPALGGVIAAALIPVANQTLSLPCSASLNRQDWYPWDVSAELMHA